MNIEINYANVRRLSISIVKNGDVHVSVPYGLPRAQVEAFVEKNRMWIEKAREKTHERQEKRTAFFDKLPLGTPEEIANAEAKLKAKVEPLVIQYSNKMGVEPADITYKAMISRWGVCNVQTKSICFSLYVLLLPDLCIEHVVVHELCHLLEPSHNDRFHDLLDQYFPHWRMARKMTRHIYDMKEDQ